MTLLCWAARHRFLILLISLGVLLAGYPLSSERATLGNIAYRGFFDLVLVAGLFSMRNARIWLLCGCLLAVPSMAITWAAMFMPASEGYIPLGLQATAHLAMGIFLILLVVFILRDLFSGRTVTTDRLCGAVSAYILIGVVFGFLYTSLEMVAPNSFVIGDGIASNWGTDEALQNSGVLFYFSLVTLTTVGYGDISPVGQVAQMLTLWEALLGQVYLAILVARLVGLHLSGSGPSAN